MNCSQEKVFLAAVPGSEKKSYMSTHVWLPLICIHPNPTQSWLAERTGACVGQSPRLSSNKIAHFLLMARAFHACRKIEGFSLRQMLWVNLQSLVKGIPEIYPSLSVYSHTLMWPGKSEQSDSQQVTWDNNSFCCPNFLFPSAVPFFVSYK